MRPDPIELLTGKLSSKPFPGGISLPGCGGKFAPDGSVMSWPGNTFICPVVPNSTSSVALLELQERIKRSEFGTLFTHLPAPSFHMTVFQGLSPGNEGTAEWPAGVPDDMERNKVTSILQERTHRVELDNDFNVHATELYGAYSLTVSGKDQHSEDVLRKNRQLLRDATQISPPNFDTYTFHITLSYLIQWLSESTARDLMLFSQALFAHYRSRLEIIELQPCTLCNFDNMHHFSPVSPL